MNFTLLAGKWRVCHFPTNFTCRMIKPRFRLWITFIVGALSGSALKALVMVKTIFVAFYSATNLLDFRSAKEFSCVFHFRLLQRGFNFWFQTACKWNENYANSLAQRSAKAKPDEGWTSQQQGHSTAATSQGWQYFWTIHRQGCRNAEKASNSTKRSNIVRRYKRNIENYKQTSRKSIDWFTQMPCRASASRMFVTHQSSLFAVVMCWNLLRRCQL